MTFATATVSHAVVPGYCGWRCSCSNCRRFLPVETLTEYRGGRKRLMRYCPTCWEHRTKAMAELKKGRPL